MYYQSCFKELSENEIIREIEKGGFTPLKISNDAGYIYHNHQHPKTKLLAFLKGEMIVTVNSKKYICKTGDKIIINGNTNHSAIVGQEGCTFFWAEKII